MKKLLAFKRIICTIAARTIGYRPEGLEAFLPVSKGQKIPVSLTGRR